SLLTHDGETWRGGWRRERMRRGWQIEGDDGPDPHLRGDRDITVVLGDNGMGNREAESNATGFGGDIGVKDDRELVLRDAAAPVPTGDLDPAPRREQRRECGITGEIVRLDFDDPAPGHRLLGIEEHMMENLLDLAGINLDRPELRREENVAPDNGAAQH